MSDSQNPKKTDLDLWREKLTPEQFYVTRECGTERPFSGRYNSFKEPGMYHCSNCDAELFEAANKFDSGTGWPSFWKAVDDAAIKLIKDTSHGMTRIEARCSKCDAHLGHLFDDGPNPTGQRYCINSVSLVHTLDRQKK